MLIDTHAHLCDAVFDDDRPQVLERAQRAGVGSVIAVAETLAEAAKNADDVTAIRAYFATLAKICSGCHEDFRQED